LLGLGKGIVKNRSLPSASIQNGSPEFRFTTPPGSEPEAEGAVISAPADISPEGLAHERVHTAQSARYGPAYQPLKGLGALSSLADTGETYFGHPMEMEAYLKTASSPNLERYLADLSSARAAKDPKLQEKLRAEAIAKQQAHKKKMERPK
jgi:hypothetical protein